MLVMGGDKISVLFKYVFSSYEYVDGERFSRLMENIERIGIGYEICISYISIVESHRGDKQLRR